MDIEAAERFERVIREDGRYPPEAYEFLHQGLERATRARHGAELGSPHHHVTGQELCEALREVALDRWGLMAPAVLRKWNIRNTRDFGEMVFLLVGIGLMGAQESDRIEDFDDVFDLRTAFGDYEIPLDNDDEDR